MKIGIIGAGAMGCLYGAKLSEMPENQVFLIDIWQEHLDNINSDGLKMEADDKVITYKNLKAAKSSEEVGSVDLAIVFVKSTLTKKAVLENKGLFGKSDIFKKGTVALTLQNGLGNIDEISAVIGEKNVVVGTTSHGATMLGPGKMRHGGKGQTIIGEIDGNETPRLLKIIEVFKKANLDPSITNNVLGLVWDKLLVNVGINALVSIAKVCNGKLLEHPELEIILEKAVREAKAVADAKGINLNFNDPVGHTKDVCIATAKNRASMLQDIENGKKTEIDMINGAIVREGAILGIETPVNLTLTNLIKFIEKGTQC